MLAFVMNERWPITGTAQVGPIELRLFPYEQFQTAVDDYDEKPWAVGALCRIKFTIGELTTTKRMTQRFSWHDQRGWARHTRPSDTEIAVAADTVLRNLRDQISRHGFDPGELTATLKDDTVVACMTNF
jgi:hypothetical protein